VATDAVLIGIANSRPTNRSGLAAVRGIHKAVVADHCEELLAIVAANPVA
jgi:hypothetical protein